MKVQLFALKAATVVGFCIGVFYFTGYAFEESPITYANIPFPTDKEVYQIGDNVNVQVNICSKGVNTVTVTQNFKNIDTGDLFYIPATSGTSKDGCRFVSGIPKYVDERIKPGKYIVEGMTVAKGRFRMHENPWTTQVFTVIDGKSQFPNPPIKGSVSGIPNSSNTYIPPKTMIEPMKEPPKAEEPKKTKTEVLIEKVKKLIPSL